MRTNLKLFRVKKNLTQEEMSQKIGCSRKTYACIENGLRDGRPRFWNSLQAAFDLQNPEVLELTKNDKQ